MKKLLFLSFLLLMFENSQAQQLTTIRNTYIVGKTITINFTVVSVVLPHDKTVLHP